MGMRVCLPLKPFIFGQGEASFKREKRRKKEVDIGKRAKEPNTKMLILSNTRTQLSDNQKNFNII